MAKTNLEEAKTTKNSSAKVKQAEKAAVAETSKKIKELIETEKIAEAIVEAEEMIAAEESKTTAKAGKRSAKAQKEAEEVKAKEERKKAGKPAENEKPKAVVKPPRSKLERAGKKLRSAAELVDRSKAYNTHEASALAMKTATTKFDSTVEIHVNLNVDPRQADQNIRATLRLPSGSGKSVRVAVLAEADDAKKALAAGADIAGLENLLAELDKENTDFDVLIATPASMTKLGKYARLLGPKGLMPNPKSGTVSADVENAVKESKSGKVEYRVDDNGIIHLAVGKVSFGEAKLNDNLQAVMDSIKASKPASVKGQYIKSAHLSTTMGPSIRLQTED